MKKNAVHFPLFFPISISLEVKVGKDEQEKKNILSYRWEDERMKVCQEKEF